MKGNRRPCHYFSLATNDDGGDDDDDDDETQTNNNNNNNNNSTEEEISNAFSQDGFCVLRQAVAPTVLKDWQTNFGTSYFHQCFETLYHQGHTRHPTHILENGEYVLGHGVKHGFREIVMRSPGRYELSLRNNVPKEQLPDINSILEPLQSFLPRLLGGGEKYSTMDEIKLCHLSLLVAAPKSVEQGWHADGGHTSLSQHLPCHCYNVFIPLLDVPLEMGPTEFRPGGHLLTRNLGPMMLAAKCRKTLRAPVWPSLELGDVVIFDYRVLHRGKANTTNTYRNVLVLTFCEPWFEDVLNFPKRSMMEPAKTKVSDDNI